MSIVVPRDFPTVQSAIDAASPGATIVVLPGTYREQLRINKDLNVVGSGAQSTIIQAPSSLSAFGTAGGGFPMAAIVQVTSSARVSISSLTVTGPAPGCDTLNPTKIVRLTIGVSVVNGASISMLDSRVTNLRDEPLRGCFSGFAIVIGLPTFLVRGGSVGHGTIRDVVVDNYQNFGITVTGAGSMATVSDNVVTGVGATPTVAQIGILVGIGAVASVTDNTVAGNICTIPSDCGADPISQSQGIGVQAFEAMPGTVIADNNVSRNDVGVSLFFSPECCRTVDNAIRDNRFFGLVIQDSNNTAVNNRISGGNVGVGVVADFANSIGTLRDNTITLTSVAPTQEISCCGVTARILIIDS